MGQEHTGTGETGLLFFFSACISNCGIFRCCTSAACEGHCVERRITIANSCLIRAEVPGLHLSKEVPAPRVASKGCLVT